MKFSKKIKSALKASIESMGYEIKKKVEPVRIRPQINIFDILARDLHRNLQGEVFFVQIGANDGVQSDPIHDLVIEYGWPGLLVEPQPEIFEVLKRNYLGRENLKFANCLVGKSNLQNKKIFIPKARSQEVSHELSGMARLDRLSLEDELAASAFSQEAVWIEEFEIEMWDLAGLFHAHSIDRVDLLVIDAEGFDLYILEMLDFDRFKPKLIMMEFFHLSDQEKKMTVEILSQQGYKLLPLLGDLVAALEVPVA